MFFGALGLRLLVVAWGATRIPPTADGTYYQTLAERIASGQGYTWLWPDGAITYAAHYPVGYPAMLGATYAMFGKLPVVGMALNALIGAAGAFAAHQLTERFGRVALLAGCLVAAHPGLVAYTPALMTEGVAGSLILVATWLANRAREAVRPASTPGGRGRWLLHLGLVGLLVGCATLIRPQLVLLAPVLGLASAPPCWKRRMASTLLVTVACVASCAPWTLRNCSRMGRCAFVSVNGGWNLLIGTNPSAGGGWAPVEVPAECRTVFDEAAKDSCFGEAALRRIASAPGRWLTLTPGKLASTFEYAGAAGWYLHTANPKAFSARAKEILGVVETAFERVVLFGALVAAFRHRLRRVGSGDGRAQPRLAALFMLGGIVVGSGVVAHALLCVGLALASLKSRLRPLPTVAFGLLASTMLVHGIFFGGGRYQLPVLGVITVIAATACTALGPKRRPT